MDQLASNVFIRDEEWKSEMMTRGTGQDEKGPGAGSLLPTGQLMLWPSHIIWDMFFYIVTGEFRLLNPDGEGVRVHIYVHCRDLILVNLINQKIKYTRAKTISLLLKIAI